MAKRRETAHEKRRRRAKDSLAAIRSWKATVEAAMKGLSRAIAEHEKDLAELDNKEGPDDAKIDPE